MAQYLKEKYCPNPEDYSAGYDRIDWSGVKKKEEAASKVVEATPEGMTDQPKETSLLVHGKRLYKLNNGGGDVFHVAAGSLEQVKALLVKRGGDHNLLRYTIEEVECGHVECIIGEVESYETMMSYHKELKKIAIKGTV